jgi:hypothetical protein
MRSGTRIVCRVLRVARFGFAALLVLAACDDLLPSDDFEPSGAQFNLNPAIEVASITGGPQPVATGTYTLEVVARSTSGGIASDLLPAGLLFSSTQRRVQHMVVLKGQQVSFDATPGTKHVGVFCCNRLRRTPDNLDTFDLGPVTDNPGLQEIVTAVYSKDISAASDLWMIQRAVWMVTDSTGLNQAYRDSLAGLPAEEDWSGVARQR